MPHQSFQAPPTSRLKRVAHFEALKFNCFEYYATWHQCVRASDLVCCYDVHESVVVNITARSLLRLFAILFLFVFSVFLQSTALGSPPSPYLFVLSAG